jgi:pimeloyl-ACP methyl ester carboxylesterase
MAPARHRAAVMSGARRGVWLIIPVIVVTLAWTAGLPAAAQPASTDPNTSPCPGISLQLQLGATAPVLLVHGFDEGPRVFTKDGSPTLKQAISGALGRSVTLVPFDYRKWKTLWVTFAEIGPRLATCITWLAHTSATQGGPGKVIIVAHSMGGLAVRCAVDPACAQGTQATDPSLIGLVITLGTPNLGSNPQTLGPVLDWVCTLFQQCNDLLIARDSPAAQAMVPGSSQLAKLPLLPGSIPVDAIAGRITETTELFGRSYVVRDFGDIAVPVASALADAQQSALHAGPGANKTTVNCGIVPDWELKLWVARSISQKAMASPVTCWHLTETTDAVWQQDIIAAIKPAVQSLLRKAGIGAAPPCTPAALASALNAANVAQRMPLNWTVSNYACQSGYAFAGIDGTGLPVVALFRQQGQSWQLIWGPTEDTCLFQQCPPALRPPVPQALLQSLMKQADRLPPATAPPSGYFRYTNPRFNFSFDVPDGYTAGAPPQDRDGQSFTNGTGTATVTGFGQDSGLGGSTPAQDLAELVSTYESSGDQVTLRYLNGDIVAVSGTTPQGAIFYQRDVVLSQVIYSLVWNYPSADKAQYSPLVDYTVSSFTPGPDQAN